MLIFGFKYLYLTYCFIGLSTQTSVLSMCTAHATTTTQTKIIFLSCASIWALQKGNLNSARPTRVANDSNRVLKRQDMRIQLPPVRRELVFLEFIYILMYLHTF